MTKSVLSTQEVAISLAGSSSQHPVVSWGRREGRAKPVLGLWFCWAWFMMTQQGHQTVTQPPPLGILAPVGAWHRVDFLFSVC